MYIRWPFEESVVNHVFVDFVSFKFYSIDEKKTVITLHKTDNETTITIKGKKLPRQFMNTPKQAFGTYRSHLTLSNARVHVNGMYIFTVNNLMVKIVIGDYSMADGLNNLLITQTLGLGLRDLRDYSEEGLLYLKMLRPEYFTQPKGGAW